MFVFFILHDFFLSSNMQTHFMLKSANENIHKDYNLKGNLGLILLWTKTYFIVHSNHLTKHIHCGEYGCQISRNRSLLPQSDLVVFNARYAKGRYIFFCLVMEFMLCYLDLHHIIQLISAKINSR